MTNQTTHAATPGSTPENSAHDTYTSPLAARNASEAMLRLWSPRHKFNTWRRIWLAVAEAQHETGLPVTKQQVEALRAIVERGITDAELARAAELERELRHDVMAHVHCLAESCPEAGPIIHLGCTSQDVVCNADMMTLWQSSQLVVAKQNRVIIAFAGRAGEFIDLPTLGFTHYQSAQPVTVGRRIAGWAYEIELAYSLYADTLPKVRGFRGATGTQASFLKLFDGDQSRVDEFEARAINAMFEACGFRRKFTLDDGELERGRQEMLQESKQSRTMDLIIERLKIREGTEGMKQENIRLSIALAHELTGQTYPRVVDTAVLSQLASTAAVLHKIATDIRLLSNRKEIDEPFGSKQIGSSAMPYKRNPMKCERICGLARFVMNLVGNAYDTAATQWLERTLDDSSNRRLSLPEAFLALDGALDLMHEVASGLVVHEAMVRKNLMAELPFLATENILMEAVKAGGDRQELHEVIRVHAQASGMRVKQEGLDNDLLERLKADPNFQGKASGGKLDRDLDWEGLMDPMRYVGRSVHQTQEFLQRIEELKSYHKDDLASLDAPESRV